MKKTVKVFLMVLALNFCFHTQVRAQVGFLFGLGTGLMLNSGGNSTRIQEAFKSSGLSGIPLRCLFVETEEDYVDCRWTSMMAELQAARNNVYSDNSVPYCASQMGSNSDWKKSLMAKDSAGRSRACDVLWHIQLEVQVLKALNQAAVLNQKN